MIRLEGMALELSTTLKTVVGIKSREVYEAPASNVAIIEAHKDLEKGTYH